MESIRVFNFSGGKTSAYMTIHNYRAGDIVLFCDTGREHLATYKFIDDFEYFENIPVFRISHKGAKDAFRQLLSDKKNKAIPNMNKRFCTVELKIKTAKRWLREQGIKKFDNYIGFRHDEPQRVYNRKQHYKNVIDKFPLFDEKINRAMIDDYFKTKPYNLEIPRILGNCTLCFMKGKNAIINILKYDPSLAAPFIEDEEQNEKGRTYFKGVTIRQLLEISQTPDLFSIDINKIEPAFNCACTS